MTEDNVEHDLIYFVANNSGLPIPFSWCPITTDGEMCDGLYDLLDNYEETTIHDEFTAHVGMMYLAGEHTERRAHCFEIEGLSIWWWFEKHVDEPTTELVQSIFDDSRDREQGVSNLKEAAQMVLNALSFYPHWKESMAPMLIQRLEKVVK